eukprot:CAMPEP_0167779762 /NCGR_PEP_ID=MMETSP0111_2-20121227/4982_1 /TAXON_ID=91324 /ORGANISM="Lotharella globosa, Strain CCCM811" /LENGTH=193 /DNA_ID=CAMNT_0007670199 /DNA_START=309 /DNA_END=889 /DNA_ORIENTATION=-
MERLMIFMLTHVNLGSRKPSKTLPENVLPEFRKRHPAPRHCSVYMRSLPSSQLGDSESDLAEMGSARVAVHVDENAQIAKGYDDAILYDIYSYNPSTDNVMNIEPAALLLVRSVPKYYAVSGEILRLLTNPPPSSIPATPRTESIHCTAQAIRVLLKRNVIRPKELFRNVLGFPKIDAKILQVVGGDDDDDDD